MRDMFNPCGGLINPAQGTTIRWKWGGIELQRAERVKPYNSSSFVQLCQGMYTGRTYIHIVLVLVMDAV